MITLHFDLLKELLWLPIEQRIKFKILLITFKALNKQAPDYITDLLIPYQLSRSLHSSTKNLLMKPMFIFKSYGGGGRSFALASAVLLNDLSQIRNQWKLLNRNFKQLGSGNSNSNLTFLMIILYTIILNLLTANHLWTIGKCYISVLYCIVFIFLFKISWKRVSLQAPGSSLKVLHCASYFQLSSR